MNRLALLISCALVACSLDVPGTGPGLTHDDTDTIHESDPIEVAPGAPPIAGPSVGGANGAAAATALSGAQALVDGGVVVTVVDASTITTVITTPSPSSDAGAKSAPPVADPTNVAFTLSSSAFDDGARLPSAFTCKGADQSPPLSWINPPANSKSFALVLTSKSAARPSASPAVEWVVWQIPAARSSLPQGVAAGSQPSNVPGARQDAASEDASVGGFTGAGGFTGFGGTVGVGVGVGGGAPGSFGGNWGGTIGGISPSVPVTSGAPFYPTGSGTSPRYHGPCGSSGVSYEFTLFALDADATSQWGSFVSIETVTQWIKTRSNILAHASLSATFP